MHATAPEREIGNIVSARPVLSVSRTPDFPAQSGFDFFVSGNFETFTPDFLQICSLCEEFSNVVAIFCGTSETGLAITRLRHLRREKGQ